MKRILSLCIVLWWGSGTLQAQERDSLLWTAVHEKNTARALELIEEGADAGPVAVDLGQQLMELGQFAQAVTYLHRALDHQVVTHGKDNADYGNRLNKLGEVYYFLGQYDQALAYFDQAMKNAEKYLGKEHADYGDRISNLGAIYWQLGRHQEALPLFREVVEIAKKTIGKGDPGYADRLSNLGFLYRELGQYDQALPLFYEALQITARTLGKEDHSYAVRLNNLAFLYRQMGQYEKALPLQQQGLQALDPEHPEYGRQLSNLGILFRLLGRYGEALPVQQRALEHTATHEGKEHQNYGLRLNNLAVLLRQMGRYEEALPLQLQAVGQVESLFGAEHPDYGRRQLQLAILYRLMEQYELSRTTFHKAMPVLRKSLGQDHPEYADALIEQAVFFEQVEDIAAASEAYRQAHQLALQRIHQSFDQFSEQEQAAMWSTLEHHFAHIQSFALQQPGLEDLRELSLNANLIVKGLLLNSRQRLLAGLREVQDPHLREQFAEWEYLKNWLARQYSRPVGKRLAAFDSLENRATELESELARQSAPFRQARSQASWEEIKATLEEGEAAIEFARFHYHHRGLPTDTVMYCAYLIHKQATKPEMIALFPEHLLRDILGEETTRKLDYVNQLYTYSGRGVTVADDSPGLYDLLWQPLEDKLDGIRSIYFSPDGLLHRITLAAIPVGEEEILADRYALHLLGSTRQLLYPVSRKEDASRERAAIFGGITYDWDSTAYAKPAETQTSKTEEAPPLASRGGEKWDYLKWTDREVEAISALLKEDGMPADVYRGYAAREEAFKRLGQQKFSPKIIHLATHGYFFPDPGSYSSPGSATGNVFRWSEHPMVRAGLILAGANRVWEGGSPVKGFEDGVLTAYEIAQLNLQNTELVVLSACETGLGDIEGNEGVYGLQRAFRIAGARYLIMSLWQVPDKETAYFMESFYKNLLQGKMSIPEAFRMTQQELRENPFITPYQWAGFVLVE